MNTLRLTTTAIALAACASYAATANAKSIKSAGKQTRAAKPETKAKPRAAGKTSAERTASKPETFSFVSNSPLVMDPKVAKRLETISRRSARSKRSRRRRALRSFGSRARRVGIGHRASATPSFDGDAAVTRSAFRKTLSERAVDRVVRQYSKQLYHCRGYAMGPRAVTVELDVSAAGHVRSATILSSGRVDRSAFARCLTRRLRRWSFPTAGEATPVRFPFRTR